MVICLSVSVSFVLHLSATCLLAFPSGLGIVALCPQSGGFCRKFVPEDEFGSNAYAVQVAEALQEAGAAAVTIHGRTMEQRYKKAADWALVQQAATALTVPVIGNGDVLTYYEVQLLQVVASTEAVEVQTQAMC